MKLIIKSFETNKENLFINKHNPDYKWIKKNYTDPDISDEEREFVDFYDSFINVKIGKHKLTYIAPNVFPKNETETIAIVGKPKGKDFIVDKLVNCRFMYDEPNEYEILGEVDRKNTEYNKDGAIVLKQKKI
ncbi:MAG: hypothetical protein DAHOPDDO_00853 [Ignavibacteriaceae bacterium]|nr:hypothetical protein [Ignavibacteriaceae bacterium]